MTIAEIQELASAGESETIEFKRTTGQRSDGARAVCGMLNGIGGFVFFGVEDDGRIVGQEVTAKTIADLVYELRRIDPQPALTPERVPLDNVREVLVVSVPGRTGGAFTYDGRPYLRQGPVTAVMPQDRYRRLLLEGAHPAHRWEILPAAGVTLDDLDRAEIERTVKEAVRRLRLDDPGTADPEHLLRAMQMIRNGQLVNAAVVLFCRQNRLAPLYPQCLLRLARFRGTDKTEFIDNRQEVGNAFDLMMRAQNFLREHLPVAGRIVPSLFERVDDPLYPPVALREALANAICHRDYTMPGGSVGVAIYDDRLEITSTGALPFGLTPETLLKPHTSQPWNPLIANVFFRRGLIEQWGRGTLKMVELTAEAGLAAPEFEQRGGEVVVRFRPTRYVPPTRVVRTVTPLQQQILEVLSATGPATLAQASQGVGEAASILSVRDNLQALRRLDLVTVAGRGRGARWKLQG
ncbi:MAG TPA: ATP-binding protein [Longimicrobium sp.]